MEITSQSKAAFSKAIKEATKRKGQRQIAWLSKDVINIYGTCISTQTSLGGFEGNEGIHQKNRKGANSMMECRPK